MSYFGLYKFEEESNYILMFWKALWRLPTSIPFSYQGQGMNYPKLISELVGKAICRRRLGYVTYINIGYL